MYKPSPQAMKQMLLVRPQGDAYEAQNGSQNTQTHPLSSSSNESSPSPKNNSKASGSSSLSGSGPAGLFADKKDAKPMPLYARRSVPLPAFTRRDKKPRSADILRRTGSNTSQFSTDDVVPIDAEPSFDTMGSLEEEEDPAPVSSVVVDGKGSPVTRLSDSAVSVDSRREKQEQILQQHEQKMQQLERTMQLQIQEQQRQHAVIQQALFEQQMVMSSRSMDAQSPSFGLLQAGQLPAYDRQAVEVAPSRPMFQSQQMLAPWGQNQPPVPPQGPFQAQQRPSPGPHPTSVHQPQVPMQQTPQQQHLGQALQQPHVPSQQTSPQQQGQPLQNQPAPMQGPPQQQSAQAQMYPAPQQQRQGQAGQQQAQIRGTPQQQPQGELVQKQPAQGQVNPPVQQKPPQGGAIQHVQPQAQSLMPQPQGQVQGQPEALIQQHQEGGHQQGQLLVQQQGQGQFQPQPHAQTQQPQHEGKPQDQSLTQQRQHQQPQLKQQQPHGQYQPQPQTQVQQHPPGQFQLQPHAQILQSQQGWHPQGQSQWQQQQAQSHQHAQRQVQPPPQGQTLQPQHVNQSQGQSKQTPRQQQQPQVQQQHQPQGQYQPQPQAQLQHQPTGQFHLGAQMQQQQPGGQPQSQLQPQQSRQQLPPGQVQHLSQVQQQGMSQPAEHGQVIRERNVEPPASQGQPQGQMQMRQQSQTQMQQALQGGHLHQVQVQQNQQPQAQTNPRPAQMNVQPETLKGQAQPQPRAPLPQNLQGQVRSPGQMQSHGQWQGHQQKSPQEAQWQPSIHGQQQPYPQIQQLPQGEMHNAQQNGPPQDRPRQQLANSLQQPQSHHSQGQGQAQAQQIQPLTQGHERMSGVQELQDEQMRILTQLKDLSLLRHASEGQDAPKYPFRGQAPAQQPQSQLREDGTRQPLQMQQNVTSHELQPPSAHVAARPIQAQMQNSHQVPNPHAQPPGRWSQHTQMQSLVPQQRQAIDERQDQHQHQAEIMASNLPHPVTQNTALPESQSREYVVQHSIPQQQQSQGQGYPQQRTLHQPQRLFHVEKNQQEGQPTTQQPSQHVGHSSQQDSSGQTRLPFQYRQLQPMPAAHDGTSNAQNAVGYLPGTASQQDKPASLAGDPLQGMTAPLQGINSGTLNEHQSLMQPQQLKQEDSGIEQRQEQRRQLDATPPKHIGQLQFHVDNTQHSYGTHPPNSQQNSVQSSPLQRPFFPASSLSPPQASQGQQSRTSTTDSLAERSRTTSYDSHMSSVSGITQNLPQFTPDRLQAQRGNFPGQVLRQYALTQTPTSTRQNETPNSQESQSPQWLADLTKQTIQHQHTHNTENGVTNIPLAADQAQWLTDLTSQMQMQQQQPRPVTSPNARQSDDQTQWLADLTTLALQNRSQGIRGAQSSMLTPDQIPEPLRMPPPQNEMHAMPTSTTGLAMDPVAAMALENLWSQAETNHNFSVGSPVSNQSSEGMRQIDAYTEGATFLLKERPLSLDSDRLETSRRSHADSMASVETPVHSNTPSSKNSHPHQAPAKQVESSLPAQPDSFPYQNPMLQTVFSGESGQSENGFQGQAPLGSGVMPWVQHNGSYHPEEVDNTASRNHNPYANSDGQRPSSPNRRADANGLQVQSSNGTKPVSTPYWKEEAVQASSNAATVNERDSSIEPNTGEAAAATAGSGKSIGAPGSKSTRKSNNSTAGSGGGNDPAGDRSPRKSPKWGLYLLCCLFLTIIGGGAAVAALYFLTDTFDASKVDDGGGDPLTTHPPTSFPSPSPLPTTDTTLEATGEKTPITLAPSTSPVSLPSSVPPPLTLSAANVTVGQVSSAPSSGGLPDESLVTWDSENMTTTPPPDEEFDYEFEPESTVIEAEDVDNSTMAPTNDNLTTTTIDNVAPVLVEPNNVTITPLNNDWPANRTTQTMTWEEVRTIPGVAPDAQTGMFLSTNTDGTIVAVGSSAEAVLVYRILPNSAVQQLGRALRPPTNGSLALSAVLSGEGNVVVVGYDDGSVQAYRFVDMGEEGSDEGRWETKGEAIRPQGVGVSAISSAVALSANGVVLVTGVLDGDTGMLSVQAYLYNSTSDVWQAVGGEILRDDRTDQATVQLSSNGFAMAFTSLYAGADGVSMGAVETFELDIYHGGINSTSRGSFTLKGVSQLSVALSVNGNTMVVTNDKLSTVYGFDWSAREWQVQPGGNFLSGGTIVSLAYSGKLLVIGSQNMVDTYEFIDDWWMRHPSKTMMQGKDADDGFGTSVAVSGDASTLAVGSPFFDDRRMGDDSGRVYVYSAISTTPEDDDW